MKNDLTKTTGTSPPRDRDIDIDWAWALNAALTEADRQGLLLMEMAGGRYGLERSDEGVPITLIFHDLNKVCEYLDFRKRAIKDLDPVAIKWLTTESRDNHRREWAIYEFEACAHEDFYPIAGRA